MVRLLQLKGNLNVNDNRGVTLELAEFVLTIYGLFKRDKPTKPEMNLYCAALHTHNIDELNVALTKHLADADEGRFFPMPAHLNQYLSKPPTYYDVLVHATRLQNSEHRRTGIKKPLDHYVEKIKARKHLEAIEDANT